MNLPRRNIAANLLGSGWTALMQLAFAPVYIHLLGMEAFGVIGIWITVQAVSMLLDLGLGTALNREMARLSAGPGNLPTMRDLLRTMEIVYLPGALLIALLALSTAPMLTAYWLQGQELNPELLHRSLVLLGLSVALQWPFGLYSSGLLGLQRQVALNVVVGLVATLRGAGAAAALWFLTPSLEVFFLVQLVASALQSVLTGLLLWRALSPGFAKAHFRVELLRSVAPFAAGLAGITLLSIILIHADKAVLSGVLSLEDFGYYVLAALAASSLSRLVGPVFAAMYPRLTTLAEREDPIALSTVYHQGSQLIAVLVLPVAMVLAMFSEEVLLLWTRDGGTAMRTAPVLSLLLIGTALNGIMHMPYALQLAHGWTQLTLRINLVAAVLIGPLTYLAATTYGIVGAASMWVALNVGYIVIGVQLMHRRLLPAEKWRWYGRDVLRPMAAAGLVVLCASLIIHPRLSPPVLGGLLTLVLLLAIGASILTVIRTEIWQTRST
jgi:O-antigen/teichoic acid export membrane protein